MRKDSTTKYPSHRDSHPLLVRPLSAVHQLCLLRNASWPQLAFPSHCNIPWLSGTPGVGATDGPWSLHFLLSWQIYLCSMNSKINLDKGGQGRLGHRGGLWVCWLWVYSLGRCGSCGPGRSPGQCRPGAPQAPVSSTEVWRRRAEDTEDRIQDFNLQGEKHAQDCSHGMLSLHLCSGRLTTSFLRRCAPLYTHSSISIVNASMISYFFFPNNLFLNFSNQRSCRYNAENAQTLPSRFFN